MVIDLTDPLFGPIAAGLIIALIVGTYHYIRTLVTLNVTNKKLGNILSELYSLQQKHKEEITKINKDSKEKTGEIIIKILSQQNKELEHFIEKIENISKSFQSKQEIIDAVIPDVFRKRK